MMKREYRLSGSDTTLIRHIPEKITQADLDMNSDGLNEN